jgi:hypothetical protein
MWCCALDYANVAEPYVLENAKFDNFFSMLV